MIDTGGWLPQKSLDHGQIWTVSAFCCAEKCFWRCADAIAAPLAGTYTQVRCRNVEAIKKYPMSEIDRYELKASWLPRGCRGVTLIELMVAVTVLAILATIGIPAFQRLVADYTINSQANATQATIQFARSEALKRRADVILCPAGPALVVIQGESCNGVGVGDADNLMVMPINDRVGLAGVPVSGVRFSPNGFTMPSVVNNIDIVDPGGVVQTRRVRVLGSGFSEIVRVGS